MECSLNKTCIALEGERNRQSIGREVVGRLAEGVGDVLDVVDLFARQVDVLRVRQYLLHRKKRNEIRF